MTDAPEPPDVWFVYVLESLARSVTYVGIAKDVEARLLQHNGERPGGAKSTRAARPWRVARRLAAQSGQALREHAVLHGRLAFGPRLTIMQAPLVANGPMIELRISQPKSLEELAAAPR